MSEDAMKRVLALLGAAAAMVLATACGGGSSGSSPTSGSVAALLLVRQTSVGLVGLSSSPDHLVRLELPVEFSNGQGTPCDLNFVRLQIYDAANVEVERAEVTADDIVALAGTNRVTQGAPLAVTLTFNFNTLEIFRAALTANALDDNGNSINRSLDSIDVELAPELQGALAPAQ
jgi:hypothetical protein